MEAMQVLKAGTRRRIGNGKDTKILELPWLPDMENGYIRTIMPMQLQDSTVDNLMEMGQQR